MDHPRTTASRRRELVFGAGGPEACNAGITWARQALADWHFVDDGDALLVAAELLTNAVRHGGGILRLTLRHDRDRFRIAVADPSPSVPHLGPHRPDTVGGHGIFIVDHIAQRWGSRLEGTGKTVWADLDVPPRA